MHLNACELEIDLFCRGLKVPPPDVSLDGARGISRTRAGLGSGLEMVIPARSWLKSDIWMNAPVVERFVERSPYTLRGSREAGYSVYDDRGFSQYPVRLPAEPGWSHRTTSRDVPISRIGVLPGDVSRHLHQSRVRVLELLAEAQLPFPYDRLVLLCQIRS
jgi:hypothetical protein